MPPTDTSDLERIYFDASQWNRLLRHPECELIVTRFDRSRHAVFPSVINAAELLNDGDESRRAQLCKLMVELHQQRHVLLDHPGAVLKATADAYRRGDRTILLTESPAATALRRQIGSPNNLTAEMQQLIRDWTDSMHADQKAFRTEVRGALAGTGFSGEAEPLPGREDFANLLFEKISEVSDAAATSGEVFSLIKNTSVWATYASSIAYEFHLQRYSLTPDERARPPDGPDHRQLIYLGLVNRFVTRDRGMLRAATWIGNRMSPPMGVRVESSSQYFESIGYPFSEE